MMPVPETAEPILSNVPQSFSWGVLHQRHPALVQQVRDSHPYPPEYQRALDQLLEEITTGPIEPLREHTPDRPHWDLWSKDYVGQQWPDVPFLWAESYFYRKLLEAVGYFRPGPWQGVDPFAPQKSGELADSSLEGELAALDDIAHLTPEERSSALVHAAVWGNRADLGFLLSDPGSLHRIRSADLLVDDSERLWHHLESSALASVCLVADNAGRELLPDLVLIDYLLDTGLAHRVELHLKPHPYYVSDATTADLVAALRRLLAARGGAVHIGQRLWQAIIDGRLEVSAHPFYCAPWSYHHLPTDLAHRFAQATATIMKGDLNYRRLVGDQYWPATTSFAALTAYFPSPVVTLRTLKSDVVVGLDGSAVAELDATANAWRVSGTHALIQARL
jgi:Damage-control phosphatase ARMT1-like domain